MKILTRNFGDENWEEYEYSRNNWARMWACMSSKGVHMWAPSGVREGMILKSSGRDWKLKSEAGR